MNLRAAQQAQEIEWRACEIATLTNRQPSAILKDAEVMVSAGYSNMEVALAAISNYTKRGRMTPLEIAQKSYEKYREAVLVTGENLPGWDELSMVKQTAFLSFSEEVIRLHGSPWENGNIDRGIPDENIPF